MMQDYRLPFLLNGVLGAILFALFAFAVAPAHSQTAQPAVTDQAISDAVEDELLVDQAVPANRIDVHTSDGIVTLIGRVNNLLAKERAGRIAETVKGVRAVVNNIEVLPLTPRADSEIHEDVEQALFDNPATDLYEIQVGVVDSIVTLSGTVDSWREQQLLEKVAKSVRGVEAVVSDITLDYQTERLDTEIKAEIEEALRWDVLVDHGLIEVSVNDGIVTLSGTVGSAAEKSRAVNDAWVAGVDAVDAEGLKVERWARDEDLRKDKYVVKSDAAIEKAVEDALRRDPRVDAANVTTEVLGGIVTLRGAVDNLQGRRAAGEDARQTVGVVDVENRLKVRPTEVRSDAQIANDIREALERSPFLEPYEILISVIDGTAYLTGTVDSYFEKVEADRVASQVKGVEVVQNNLDVDATYEPLVFDPYLDDYDVLEYEWYEFGPRFTLRSDREILDDIQDEIFWSPFVDADEVTVIVDDGVATLTGTVDSWSEFHAATENAFEGGATWVRNRLDVEVD